MRAIILVLLVTSAAGASESTINAAGLHASSFGADGRLSRVFTAKSGSGPFVSPVVRNGRVEFFGKESSKVVVAALEWEEAKYSKPEEVITGDGGIQLSTDDGVVSGQGFRCELEAGRLELRSNVSFKNGAFRMKGDRAKIAFRTTGISKSDVVRHIAVMGNVLFEQAATTKAPFERAESTFAEYRAEAGTVSLKTPISAWRKGERSVIDAASGFLVIDLKEETPNQAVQPTPGSVTPRASSSTSK